MKVAFIIHSFPSITEAWFIEQVISLFELGVEISIYAFERGDELKNFPELDEYDILNNTHYPNIPSNHLNRYLVAPFVFLFLAVTHPIVTVRSMKLFLTMGFKEYVRYLFLIKFFTPSIRQFDIIHCHFGKTANKFLLIRDSLGSTQPLFTTIYGQDARKYVEAKGRGVYNALSKECSLLLTMTDNMTDFFIDLGFSRERVKTHYTAVRIKNYQSRLVSVKRGEDMHFAFVGRFVDKKGIPDLLQAFSLVLKSHNNVHLHVFGDGPNKAEIDELLSDLKLGKNVTLYGLTPHHKVLSSFNKMHMLVQPSRRAENGDTDDLPFVLLEAQACGLPVITTNHVGIPEGVWVNHSGFLVNEGDIQALVDKMNYIIENPELLTQMSRDARNFIENKFSLSVLSQDLLKLYEKVLKN